MTYEFPLGAAAWQRLALTVTLPTGPQLNGNATTAVYNFRTSTWDALPLSLSHPTDVPAPADERVDEGPRGRRPVPALVVVHAHAAVLRGAAQHAVGHQATSGNEVAVRGDRGQLVLGRQRCCQVAMNGRQWACRHD